MCTVNKYIEKLFHAKEHHVIIAVKSQKSVPSARCGAGPAGGEGERSVLTIEMLIWDIRDRILFQRLENKVLPAHQAALLFDGKESLRGNRFYTGHWRDLPPTAPLGCVSSVFLCVLDDDAEWKGTPDATYRNLIVFSGSAVSLHNHIVSRLQAYNEWLERLRGGEELQTLIELAAEKTGHPMAIVNSFFQCVAISAVDDAASETLRELRDEGKTNYERARRMLPTEKAALHTERFFLDGDSVRLVDQVIRHGDKTTARILMDCPVDERESIALGYLDDLSRAIRPRILTDQTLREFFTDAMSMLLSDIIDQKVTDPDEIEQRRIVIPDMVKGTQYHPIVLKFQKQSQPTPYNYIMGHLKEIFPRSSTAQFNDGLVVLAAKDDYYDELEFDRAHLTEVLEQFNGYAGVGNCTRYLTSLRPLYIQAAAATRLGRVFCEDKTQRIFYYRDYSMYLMVDLAIESAVRQHKFGNITYLCQPGIMQVVTYDHDFGTDLMNTLRTYLKTGSNATACAQEMGVHRNTINYRINMIEDLLGYKLDRFETVLQLGISLHLLDYEELYLGCDPMSTMGKLNMPTNWDLYISMADKQ